ncbi:MAG: hypothetical protein IRZ07_16660 [Microbispora sp.]|nr:hypothetical protein [Microbispora sp.]
MTTIDGFTTADGQILVRTVAGRNSAGALILFVTAAEDKRPTPVLPQQEADAAGLAYEHAAGWMTLRVHSAPEAVGLTVAIAQELAAILSCDVVAGSITTISSRRT